MSTEQIPITLSIDNRTITAARGATILEAARAHGIEIPTLCYLDGLSAHGGCRMCIVEVEGVRTFPTACTTPVEEGMIVRTRTAQIEAMRRDILQLFLTEHTSSCLVRGQEGRVQGVHAHHPQVRGHHGLPVLPQGHAVRAAGGGGIHGHRPHRSPDLLRNLGWRRRILLRPRLQPASSRAVCPDVPEVRTANVLAYKNRGRNTIIGPAFHRTHWRAAGEFCGAAWRCARPAPCARSPGLGRASPTGRRPPPARSAAWAVSSGRWVKDERVIGSPAADDPVVNQGQLCVKGRFCNTELVSGYRRLRTPMPATARSPRKSPGTRPPR